MTMQLMLVAMGVFMALPPQTPIQPSPTQKTVRPSDGGSKEKPGVPDERSSGTATRSAPAIDAPVVEADRARAVARGVEYLLASQNKNGSWGSPTMTKDLNIMADIGSHRAFRMGATSLSLMALCSLEEPTPDVLRAIERGDDWLATTAPSLKRGSSVELYNVWGHAYAIRAFMALKQRPKANKDRFETYDRLANEQMQMLERFASIDGGWGYYDFKVQAARPTTDSTSFVNATVLLALDDARRGGLKPPEKMVKKAVTATLRQRNPDFSYLYGEYLKNRPALGINRHGGSLGRTQACNLALLAWGDSKVTVDVMRTCTKRFFDRHLWLDIGRKRPVPHESWMQVAGYFFYYGHFYTAYCIEKLPAGERAQFQDRLARILIDRQELDGSWFDFVLYDYHKQYGTAYAILSLQKCKKAAP